MKKEPKKDESKRSLKDSEDLKNLDRELKDLINTNETLHVGIKKIFKEITKKENNNLKENQ